MVIPDFYNSFVAIVPDDFRSLRTLNSNNAWGVYVGTGGHVVLVGTDGLVAAFKNVPSGTTLRCHATKVMATGTTATDIVALYSVAHA